MSDKTLTFADDFPAADAAEWQRMAEKALKGRALDDALVSHSDEGLPVRALSTAADNIPLAGVDGHSGRWDIRQAALHPDPAEANKEILADLAGGATSVALYLNDGGAGCEVAGQGVMIPDLAALDATLKDVLLEVAGVSLAAGPATFATAAALGALWEQRGVADDKARGWLNADPLHDLAATGSIAGGMDAAYDRLADLAKTSAARWANVRSIAVTTHACHNAGCGEAQELAVALATGVAYLRALKARGLDPEVAAREITFRVTADTDIFLTIAKLRALRSLWAQVLAACDASGEMQIEATTAPRMFTRLDAPVNILRGTAACMAAAVGGADAITILPHTKPLGLADSPARRIARNVQVILEEESGLAHVADPAAGSFAIETLSGELSGAAWKLFQKLEEKGGMAAALSSGWIQDEIEQVRDRRNAAISAGDKRLTGVNSFADTEAAMPHVLTPDLASLAVAPSAKGGSDESGAADVRITPLAPMRLSEAFEETGEGGGS